MYPRHPARVAEELDPIDSDRQQGLARRVSGDRAAGDLQAGIEQRRVHTCSPGRHPVRQPDLRQRLVVAAPNAADAGEGRPAVDTQLGQPDPPRTEERRAGTECGRMWYSWRTPEP